MEGQWIDKGIDKNMFCKKERKSQNEFWQEGIIGYLLQPPVNTNIFSLETRIR